MSALSIQNMGKKQRLICGLTLSMVCLVASLLLGGRAHAASIADTTFPNPNANTGGYPMYMTIGFGEFNNPYAASYIMSDTTGTINVDIDEAEWCNDSNNYTYRSLDLPLSSQFLQAYFRTLFEVRSIDAAKDLSLPAKDSVYTNNYTATCANRTLKLSFTLDASDANPDRGTKATTAKYGAVFIARPASFNPAYGSPPAAAENSFRITVSGTATAKATFLPYNIPILGNLFSMSNRNRPTNSFDGYSIDFTPSCSLVATTVGVAFYDADYLLYQSVFGKYNDLTYSFKSAARGAPPSTTIMSGIINGASGTWWPGPSSSDFATAVIDGNHSYNLTVDGLSYLNAISYGINIPSTVLDDSPCFSPDTPPVVTITQNCTAPFTATITVTDPDSATNSASPLINYSLNGVAQASVRANSYVVNMPNNGTTALSISADSTGINPSPPGGDGPASASVTATQNFGPCTFTFLLVPQPQPPDLNDPELPVSATAKAFAGFSGGAAVVNGVATTKEFFVNRGGTYNASAGTIVGGSLVSPPLSPSSVAATVNISGNPADLGITAINGIPTLKTGDYVCFKLTVNPSSGIVNAAGTIQPGYPGPGSGLPVASVQCTTVVSRPYLKVFGSDIMAGSGFGSTCTAPASDVIGFAKQLTAPAGDVNKWVGAGAQLGVFANGSVTSFASSSLLAPLEPSTSVFSNASAAGPIFGGGFGSNFCDDDFWASKSTSLTASAGAIPALHSLSEGQHQYAAGSVISSAPQPITKRIAIYVDGDVTITADEIKMSSTGAASAPALPSFYLIVRGNIYIAPNVKRLDGIYVAMPKFPATSLGTPADGGRIFTCTDNGATPSQAVLYSTCRTNSLTVNGSFSATHINFLRGGGSLRDAKAAEQPNSNNIAEVFNFLPETLLATPAPKLTTSGQYDSVISLPPGL